MRLRLIATALTATLVATTATIALDANLPAYQTFSGISGQLKSVGSDTLNNEMERWAKGFEAHYPDVKIVIDGKGSATAPPALLQGASQFAPMSRPVTADEVGAFEKKYGYKPARFRVAVDALAISAPSPWLPIMVANVTIRPRKRPILANTQSHDTCTFI